MVLRCRDLSSGTYTGEIDEHGKRHGYGRLICTDGGSYEGSWSHGIINGYGVYTWPNGNKHYGGWINGERTGRGTRASSSIVSCFNIVAECPFWPLSSSPDIVVRYCSVVRGTWRIVRYPTLSPEHQRDRIPGAFYWSEGHIYQGEFYNNSRHGKGNMWYTDGSKYSGEWRDDERHGRGILFVGPSQTIYSANWVAGVVHGFGIFRTKEGHVYIGNFFNGKRHGPGEITWTSEKRVFALWHQGVRDESSVRILPWKEPWKPPAKFFQIRLLNSEVFLKRRSQIPLSPGDRSLTMGSEDPTLSDNEEFESTPPPSESKPSVLRLSTADLEHDELPVPLRALSIAAMSESERERNHEVPMDPSVEDDTDDISPRQYPQAGLEPDVRSSIGQSEQFRGSSALRGRAHFRKKRNSAVNTVTREKVHKVGDEGEEEGQGVVGSGDWLSRRNKEQPTRNRSSYVFLVKFSKFSEYPDWNSAHQSPVKKSPDQKSERKSPDRKSPDRKTSEWKFPERRSPDQLSPRQKSPDGNCPLQKSPTHRSRDEKNSRRKSPEQSPLDKIPPTPKSPRISPGQIREKSPNGKSPEQKSPDQKSPLQKNNSAENLTTQNHPNPEELFQELEQERGRQRRVEKLQPSLEFDKEKDSKGTDTESKRHIVTVENYGACQSPGNQFFSRGKNGNFGKIIKADEIDDGILRQTKNFMPFIRGGTKEKLIECLTYEDIKYVHSFLLTYRTFVPPEELLNELFKVYYVPPPDKFSDLYEMEMLRYQEKLKLSHRKLVNVIKMWLSNHFYDFDDALIDTLRHQVQNTFSANNQTQLAQQIFTTLEEQILKQNQRYKLLDIQRLSLVFSVTPPTPAFPKSQKFDDFDLEEVARQLCLYEQYLYQSIHPKELIVWIKDKSSAPNLVAAMNFSNSVVHWISTQILLPKTEKGCAKMIYKFLMIMFKCREYNNFSALFEIHAAFQSCYVFRLKSSWTRIGKQKQLWLRYEQIAELLSAEGNYKNYREALANSGQPCIPYLGRFLSDLIFIEDGNPNYLENVQNHSNIINFDKMRSLAAVIEKIILYQQTPYAFHKVEWIYNYFARGLASVSENECYAMSVVVEPKSVVNNFVGFMEVNKGMKKET